MGYEGEGEDKLEFQFGQPLRCYWSQPEVILLGQTVRTNQVACIHMSRHLTFLRRTVNEGQGGTNNTVEVVKKRFKIF